MGPANSTSSSRRRSGGRPTSPIRRGTVQLSGADHAELEPPAAAERRSADPFELTRDDFPLDRLGAKLGAWSNPARRPGLRAHRRARHGRYDDDDLTLLYSGIGLHLGEPWAQNKYGHVLGDVTDQGKTIDDPTVRGNELGGIALDYHTDGSDLVGLLCLRTARTGGLSCVANAVASTTSWCASGPIWRRRSTSRCPTTPAASRPRGAGLLFRAGVHRARRSLFVRFIPQYILASQRHPDAPRRPDGTGGHRHGVRHGQRPGVQRLHGPAAREMQFINNYHVLHGRTAYEDEWPTATSGTSSDCGWPPTRRPPAGALRGARRRGHWEAKRSVSTLPAVERCRVVGARRVGWRRAAGPAGGRPGGLRRLAVIFPDSQPIC